MTKDEMELEQERDQLAMLTRLKQLEHDYKELQRTCTRLQREIEDLGHLLYDTLIELSAARETIAE